MAGSAPESKPPSLTKQATVFLKGFQGDSLLPVNARARDILKRVDSKKDLSPELAGEISKLIQPKAFALIGERMLYERLCQIKDADTDKAAKEEDGALRAPSPT